MLHLAVRTRSCTEKLDGQAFSGFLVHFNDSTSSVDPTLLSVDLPLSPTYIQQHT